MDNYKGLSGGLYLITEWIMKFSLVNLYFLLFNLPIVFIMFFILLPQQVVFNLLFIPIIIMVPFLLFPAASALFAVVRDYIIKDRTPASIFRLYLKYYQENYKRSLFGGIFFTILWVVWIVNLYYLFSMNTTFFYLMLATGIILYALTINFFSINVHYYLPFWASLKHTILMTLSSPVLFLAIAISSGFILYISFEVVTFILPFFTFSLISFFAFAAFYQSYLRVNKDSKGEEG